MSEIMFIVGLKSNASEDTASVQYYMASNPSNLGVHSQTGPNVAKQI